MTNDDERLAEEIHKVYCEYHENVRGEEYWTKGDYSLLDEETKEADRYMGRFVNREKKAYAIKVLQEIISKGYEDREDYVIPLKAFKEAIEKLKEK